MTIKSERVADLIFQHLAQILLTDVRDPRLTGVSVTDVTVDREIEHAWISINALGEEERSGEIMDAIERANGFLRSELASRLRLRRMPQLHFNWDYGIEEAMHIEDVLDDLRSRGEIAHEDEQNNDEHDDE